MYNKRPFNNNNSNRSFNDSNRGEKKSPYSQFSHKQAKAQQELVFGLRAIIEAIKGGRDFEKVMMRYDLKGDLAMELRDLLKTTSIPLVKIPGDHLDKITRKNHQGAIGFASEVKYQDIEDLVPMLYDDGKVPFIVVLDSVTDVRNFGAIVRSAECAGAHAVLVPAKNSAAINADAVKTAAGALDHIPVCRTNNLRESLKFLKDSGLTLFAATEKADDYYYTKDFTGPVAIVMGSEDVGIADHNLEICDEAVKIPMLGNIQSLNVSVATGIFLFEVVKQRSLSTANI